MSKVSALHDFFFFLRCFGFFWGNGNIGQTLEPIPTHILFSTHPLILILKSCNGIFWNLWICVSCPCSHVRRTSPANLYLPEAKNAGVMACPHFEKRLWCTAGDVVRQECSIYTADQEPRNTWLELPRLSRALSTSLNLQCDHSPPVNWHTLPCFTKASRG